MQEKITQISEAIHEVIMNNKHVLHVIKLRRIKTTQILISVDDDDGTMPSEFISKILKCVWANRVKRQRIRVKRKARHVKISFINVHDRHCAGNIEKEV